MSMVSLLNSNFKLHGLRKSLLCVSLLFVLLISCVSSCVLMARADDSSLVNVYVHVRTAEELQGAINNADNGVPTGIVFLQDIALVEMLRIPADKNIVLMSDADGDEFFKLIGPSNKATIVVEDHGVLTLAGIVVTHNNGAIGNGVIVNSGGELVMVDGKISGNTITVNMEYILAGGSMIYGFYGAGVYNEGTFDMYGGIISDNNVFAGTGLFAFMPSQGGGVCNMLGTFDMFGGEISNNAAYGDQGLGGGVCNYHGSFSMFGGVISNNNARYGGGVYATDVSGVSLDSVTEVVLADSFDMFGGEISYNTADCGGGLYLQMFYLADLIDGVISDNTAVSDGGGIWLSTDDFDKLFVRADMVFERNQASTATDRDPDYDDAYNTHIFATTWTEPLQQGYNNYDISYVTDFLPLRDHYTVTVHDSYAELSGTGNYLEDDFVTINAGIREGYTFSGWEFDVTGGMGIINLNSQTSIFRMPAKNVVATANWTPISTIFVVTFDYNYVGAPDADEVPVANGATVERPDNPVREGYEFLGWFEDAGAEVAFDFDMPIAEDVTLFAGWQLVSEVVQVAMARWVEPTVIIDAVFAEQLEFAGGDVISNGLYVRVVHLGMGRTSEAVISLSDSELSRDGSQVHVVTTMSFPWVSSDRNHLITLDWTFDLESGSSLDGYVGYSGVWVSGSGEFYVADADIQIGTGGPPHSSVYQSEWAVVGRSTVPVVLYPVVVVSDGTGTIGSGSFVAGETVGVYAGVAPKGSEFESWVASSAAVGFEDDSSVATTFVMPAESVTVTANFKLVVLTGLEVTESPFKTAYVKDEVLDLDGLVVIATYSNGNTKQVLDYTTDPIDGTVLDEVGVQLVRVSYTEGGVTQTVAFNVMVNVLVSDVATLSELSVDGVLLSGFDPLTLVYSVDVAYDVDCVEIVAVPTDVNAKVTGDFGVQELVVGLNRFVIVVTAENGCQLEYVLTVTREAGPYSGSGRMALAYWYVPTAEASVTIEAFFAETLMTDAGVVVPNGLYIVVEHERLGRVSESVVSLDDSEISYVGSEVHIRTVMAFPWGAGPRNHVIELDWVFDSSGVLSVEGFPDVSSVWVVVSGEFYEADATILIGDGSGNHPDVYESDWAVVGGISLVSDVATLSELSVSVGVLVPMFDPEELSYAVSVPYAVDGVEIFAVATDVKATVFGAGMKILQVGKNSFDVIVTAENGEMKTYTISVTREAVSDDVIMAYNKAHADFSSYYNTLNWQFRRDLFVGYTVDSVLKAEGIMGAAGQAHADLLAAYGKLSVGRFDEADPVDAIVEGTRILNGAIDDMKAVLRVDMTFYDVAHDEFSSYYDTATWQFRKDLFAGYTDESVVEAEAIMNSAGQAHADLLAAYGKLSVGRFDETDDVAAVKEGTDILTQAVADMKAVLKLKEVPELFANVYDLGGFFRVWFSYPVAIENVVAVMDGKAVVFDGVVLDGAKTWVSGVGYTGEYSYVDAVKTNDWQQIVLTISANGQVITVTIVNDQYVPVVSVVKPVGFIGYYMFGDAVLSTSFYWQTLNEGDLIDWVAVDAAYADWVARGGLMHGLVCVTSGSASFAFDYGAVVGYDDFTTPGQLESYYLQYYVDSGYVLPAVKVVSVTPEAFVKQLNGNKNDLTITITEKFSDGTTNVISQTFSINNNAADTYTVGSYKVYVDTKGNTQIRACYLV